MKIIPFAIERFPLHRKMFRDTDLAIHEAALLPDFIIGYPIEIGFWIGRGSSESEILDKRNAIWSFEVSRMNRQVEVFPLQSDDAPIQLFISIRRPIELKEFPDRTTVNVFEDTQGNIGRLHRKT